MGKTSTDTINIKSSDLQKILIVLGILLLILSGSFMAIIGLIFVIFGMHLPNKIA